MATNSNLQEKASQSTKSLNHGGLQPRVSVDTSLLDPASDRQTKALVRKAQRRGFFRIFDAIERGRGA